MKPGERYYIIVHKAAQRTIDDVDPITGYEETLKFNTEADALDYMHTTLADAEDLTEAGVEEEFEVQSLRW